MTGSALKNASYTSARAGEQGDDAAASTAPGSQGASVARGLPRSQAWYLTVVLFLTATAAQMDRQMISMIVEPMKADLHFTDEQMGLLMGFAFSAAYAGCAPFVGQLADRHGRKRVLSVGLLAWSTLTMMCSAAAAFPVLLLLRLGVGIGESTFQPTSLPMVASAFPPERRSFPIALCVAGLTLGMTLTPLLAGLILTSMAGRELGPFPLVGMMNGWRMALLCGGALGLLVLAMLLVAKEPDADAVRREAVPFGAALSAIRLDRRTFAALILAPPLFAMGSAGMTAWMPAYLARSFDLPPSSIGLFIGAAWMPSIALSPLIAGWLGNRATRSVRQRDFFRHSLWLMPVAGGAMALSLSVQGLAPCFALYLLSTIASGTAMTFGTLAVQQVASAPLRSHVTGLFAAALSVIGWGLGPFLIGAIATRVLGEQAIGSSILMVVLLSLPLALVLDASAFAARRTSRR